MRLVCVLAPNEWVMIHPATVAASRLCHPVLRKLNGPLDKSGVGFEGCSRRQSWTPAVLFLCMLRDPTGVNSVECQASKPNASTCPALYPQPLQKAGFKDVMKSWRKPMGLLPVSKLGTCLSY